jgi:hypothetical protein
MGRKPKTKATAPGASAEKPKPKAAAPAGIGDNKLTDDELRTLAFQHRDKYAKALAKKKIADADLKDVCKKAKAEMGAGAVEVIKDLIALEDPEGEATMRAELARRADAMRWAGLPLGTQLAMQLAEPDRTPSVDRAFDEGKKMSAEGLPAKPPFDPSTPQYRAFMEGYAEHQAVLAGKIGRGDGEAQAPA